MLRNYLTIAIRNLRRNAGYTAINLIGLAVGIACCLLLGLYVTDELSYDHYHERADRIYRITLEEQGEGEAVHWARTPPALAPVLVRDVPAVRQAVRLIAQERTLIRVGAERLQEDAFCYVDQAFFEVFSFTQLHGKITESLAAPGTAVLTRSAAEQYFGEVNAVDETFTLPSGRGTSTVEVVGIVDDMPSNSHFRCNVLVSTGTLTATAPPSFDFDRQWSLIGVYTYVLLPSKDHATRLASQLATVAQRYVPERNFRFHVQPLTSIHLHSHLEAEIEPNGHITYVRVFGGVALLILLVGCINFVNLTTAQATRRAHEVGVRKATGALRRQLATQFLTESTTVAVLAGLIASGLVWGGLPLLNELSGKALTLGDTASFLGVSLLVVVLCVGLLAGSYPAFVLSAFRPAVVLRGKAGSRALAGEVLRKGLVVVQFMIAVGLVASAVVVYNQLHYVQQKPLGFEKEHVVVVPNFRSVEQRDLETVRQELLRHEGIRGVAAARYAPTRVSPNFNLVRSEGHSEAMMALLHPVDATYPDVLDLSLVEGRSFNRTLSSDSSAVLINEEAARRLGWTDPLGKIIRLPSGSARRIIGVVKDIHYRSLREAIEPSILYLPDSPRAFRELIIRLAPGDTERALASLEETWTAFAPEESFGFVFLDESYAALYRAERRTAAIIGGFAGLGMVLACLGLLGLAAYAAERRTKEVGIRKALGASASNIVALLSKEFLLLVGVACVVATPLAYLAMQRWLQDFAYRIDISPWLFVAAGGVAVGVAMATIGYHALRAARTDPAEALRYE